MVKKSVQFWLITRHKWVEIFNFLNFSSIAYEIMMNLLISDPAKNPYPSFFTSNLEIYFENALKSEQFRIRILEAK